MTTVKLLPRVFSVAVFWLLSVDVGAQGIDAEIGTILRFYNQAEVECYLRVGEGEPYIAFNGDCRLYRDDVLVVIHPGQGVPIEWPDEGGDANMERHAVDWSVPPVPDVPQCGSFGWADGSGQLWVILGHATDSSQNYYFPESRDCKSYRPVTIASCPVVLLTCNGSTVLHSITAYINEPYPITNVLLEKSYSGQSWLPGYDGPYSCPSTSDWRSYFWRIIVTTEFFGSDDCDGYIQINPWNACDDPEW